jgi:hypothetical protein
MMFAAGLRPMLWVIGTLFSMSLRQTRRGSLTIRSSTIASLQSMATRKCNLGASFSGTEGESDVLSSPES